MEEYRLVQKKLQKQTAQPSYKKVLYSYLNKFLITVILTLSCLIAGRNKTYKEEIYKYVYRDNFSFAQIESHIKKYLGEIVPTPSPKESITEPVASEKLTYENLEEVTGGVRVKVEKSTPVTALESGLVIFVGEKENLGPTLVLEQVDGIEAWYVGLQLEGLELYDYIEKDSTISSTQGDYLTLYFKQKGEYVDYQKYLS